MKVILYTTSDCMFSKQEKEYLASKNITFEEKNVQTNRSFLQEMLDVSSNFAGTPVTKIEKDDGQAVVLKGFTQSEFDNVFAANVQAANSTIPTPPTNQPVSTPQPDPVVPEPKPEETPAPVEPPIAETPSSPDPLPPMPASDQQTQTQADTTTEMHSTIPIDQPSTNIPTTPPTTPNDQPSEPTPMPPVETPSVETPPTPQEPSTTQDQQLNSILDSLKTKAEEPTAAPKVPDFPGATQPS